MEELDFSELRKIQKQESRQDQLAELENKFLLLVSDYLNQKKETEGKSREYRNAKRVFEKIVSLREDKIIKNARLAVKSEVDSSTLNLLPEEQGFFRDAKKLFREYRDGIDEKIDNGFHSTAELEEVEEDDEEIEDIEEEEENEDYQKLEITTDVPEFMGTDLETYGPFEEGENAEIPEENAEILVNRGSAERVD